MTTKELLCKQIITLMDNENITKFMVFSREHIININYTFKSIKLDVSINFICFDYHSLIITSNKITSPSDLGVVKNYIRNINFIDLNNIQTTCLLQSKSYLKILDISYFIEGTNTPINSGIIELIIKSIYIFNNINITSKSHIVKVLLKSDIAII